MVVDAHVHLYPPEINRAAAAWAAGAREPVWAALCTRVRRDGRAVQAFPGVDQLLHDLDTAGVDRAILLGWYWETPAAATLQNRFYAECVRAHPDRLSACATVQPAVPAHAAEEMRWAKEHGLVGIGELSPHSVGLAGEDPRWHAVLGLAGELDLPVNLHVTDPASRLYPGRVDTPLGDFASWAQAYPRTTFVLAHGGGRILRAHPEVRALPNVFFDTAAFPLLYPIEETAGWLAEVGSDRLLWGTDWPLQLFPRTGEPSMSGYRAALAEAGLGPAAESALWGGNAARVYRLPGPRQV